MVGLISVHVRADMGSDEWAAIDFESRAVSARVTKHFVTTSIFSKTCNKKRFMCHLIERV